MSAQDYTTMLKRRVVAKSIDQSPQPAHRRYNYVPLLVQGNRADQVVKLVRDPTKSQGFFWESAGWADTSRCCVPSILTGWNTNLDGDGSINFVVGGANIVGPNDGTDEGWSYIYRQFTSSGSFTYTYTLTSADEGLNVDWPFEYVTTDDPSDEANINAYISDDNNTYASNVPETGTRTVNYNAGDYVVLGIFSSDSCCGRGNLLLTGLP